jgi:hypothetical protein
MKSFVQQFFVKPPVIFPLVACFLLFLTLSEVYLTLFSSDVAGFYKLRPIIMIAMTVFWIGATLFKKWGALGFVVLTVMSLAAYFYIDSIELKTIFGNILMLQLPVDNSRTVPIPLSAIFSFIALFFYGRMS